MATVKLELATTKRKIDDKYNQLNSRVDYQKDYSHQNILGTGIGNPDRYGEQTRPRTIIARLLTN